MALAVLRLFCRITVEGREHIPRSGCFILVGNHVNPLEAPLVAGVTPRSDLAIVVSEHIRRRPVLGRALDLAYDILWINRMTGRATLLDQGRRLLSAGRGLVLTPEGRYSWDGRLSAGDDGPAHLALTTGAPLVPVVTLGLEKVGKRLRRGRRSPVGVRFGAPFRIAPAGSRDDDAVRAATAQIMTTLAAMLPRVKRGRWDRTP